MKSKKEMITQITIVLSADEAYWLHVLMANPFNGNTVDNEPPVDAEMRNKFFEATNP